VSGGSVFALFLVLGNKFDTSNRCFLLTFWIILVRAEQFSIPIGLDMSVFETSLTRVFHTVSMNSSFSSAQKELGSEGISMVGGVGILNNVSHSL
jgi:hypothetical protein